MQKEKYAIRFVTIITLACITTDIIRQISQTSTCIVIFPFFFLPIIFL